MRSSSEGQIGVLIASDPDVSPRGAFQKVIVPSAGELAGTQASLPVWKDRVVKYGSNNMRHHPTSVSKVTSPTAQRQPPGAA
jgi:hypothetical protein